MIENRITGNPRWQLRQLARTPSERRTSVDFQIAAAVLLSDLSVDDVSRALGVAPSVLRSWKDLL